MKIGLQVADFTWPGAPDSIGPPEHEMLEGYAALAYAAGVTKTITLGTLVTGVTYRHPGLLIKTVTTLDVLSGGRAWLGIGAAWNEDESRSLGFPFPPLGERFEMLEETLRMAHGMFDGQRGTEAEFHGRQFHATRLLNSPQSLSRPRVPIMVGGGGEKKTLRLVAQYADACNVFGTPEAIARKYAILAQHCAAIGRDPDEIERSTLQDIRISAGGDGGTGGQTGAQIVDRFGELADAGAQHVIVSLRDLVDPSRLDLVGRDVIPHLRSL